MRRTNVVLDEKKVSTAKLLYDIKTTKELIDFALTELLKAKESLKILDLRGKINLDIDLIKSRKVR